MERVFSILARAWTRGKRLAIATELGRRPCSSTTGKANIYFFVSGTLFLVLLCCILQFPVLNSVFQYYCSGVNVDRVRGPTVSLGAVGPREFDLLTPAAQHQ